MITLWSVFQARDIFIKAESNYYSPGGIWGQVIYLSQSSQGKAQREGLERSPYFLQSSVSERGKNKHFVTKPAELEGLSLGTSFIKVRQTEGLLRITTGINWAVKRIKLIVMQM